MEYTNRKFGIEIEFVGACKYQVAEAINAAGVDCEVEYYNHTTRAHWKIVTDSSLDSIRGHAAELVSPILQGKAGIEELQKVVNALNSVAGVTVNRSCGLHVHLNCVDLNVKEIQSIYERYANYEEQIDLCLPRSRRGSMHWCKTLKEGNNIARVKRANRKERLADLNGRYYKVNLTQIAHRGAIEFRQHSGTTDFTKIFNWLCFLMQFVETSCALAGSQITVRPSNSRAYAKFRNVVENANGSMTWCKQTRRWKIELNEQVVLVPNSLLNTMHNEAGINYLTVKDYFYNNFGLVFEPNTDLPRPTNVQIVNDSGIFHGITEKIQDYLNERKEELA